MLFFSVSRQQKLNFGDINSRLKKLCLSNPSNYIKDPSKFSSRQYQVLFHLVLLKRGKTSTGVRLAGNVSATGAKRGCNHVAGWRRESMEQMPCKRKRNGRQPNH